jgi:hypothetical protein
MQPSQAGSHKPTERANPVYAALVDVMERVENSVIAETEALRQFKVVDLRDFNSRKSQGLLELMRVVRSLGGAKPDESTTARLRSLRARLESNRALLATHLRAAREITSLVAATIRDSESDGTYSNTKSHSPW